MRQSQAERKLSGAQNLAGAEGLDASDVLLGVDTAEVGIQHESSLDTLAASDEPSRVQRLEDSFRTVWPFRRMIFQTSAMLQLSLALPI